MLSAKKTLREGQFRRARKLARSRGGYQAKRNLHAGNGCHAEL
jgi:hypothetical protein